MKHKYKAQLEKRENMAYDELIDPYTCANGRVLKPIEVKMRESRTGYRKEVTIMKVKLARVSLTFNMYKSERRKS